MFLKMKQVNISEIIFLNLTFRQIQVIHEKKVIFIILDSIMLSVAKTKE